MTSADEALVFARSSPEVQQAYLAYLKALKATPQKRVGDGEKVYERKEDRRSNE